MQFLDPGSRLKAARCSRQLLAAADDEFAWAAGGVARLLLSNHSLSQPSRIQSSLLRHAPIALHVVSGGAACIPGILAVGHLRELRLHLWFAQQGPGALLVHPSLQDLRVLHLSDPACLRTLELVAALPRLQSLALPSLTGRLENQEGPHPSPFYWPGDLAPLLHMAQLTELEMRDWKRPYAEDAAIIGRLVQLRSLRLTAVDNMATAFAHFPVDSPMLAQLRHLTIEDFCVYNDSAGHVSALSRLPQVESLRLIRAREIDSLLASLHHAPALRLLVVECSSQHPSQIASEGPSHPSGAALRSLLTAAPLLQVQLQVPSLERWNAAMRAQCYITGRILADGQWAPLQQLAADLRPRVTLLTVDTLRH
jgi:hypothetical protein